VQMCCDWVRFGEDEICIAEASPPSVAGAGDGGCPPSAPIRGGDSILNKPNNESLASGRFKKF
jgi:hypothetical protein